MNAAGYSIHGKKLSYEGARGIGDKRLGKSMQALRRRETKDHLGRDGPCSGVKLSEIGSRICIGRGTNLRLSNQPYLRICPVTPGKLIHAKLGNGCRRSTNDGRVTFCSHQLLLLGFLL